ncbi:MAG: 6-carboxytetrahydropterin synthase [Rhodothermia bacterium]|nr:6-carboxytetrahydropterin synthase [Rhodothermia bacterium]
MPRVYITRQVHFNAAHRLHNPAFDDAWNQAIFGHCNHPNWHGHNYVLEVTLAGSPDPHTGYLMDLGKLSHVLHERIVAKCDHRNLNLDVDFLQGIIPSAENLVVAFWNELVQVLPAGLLYAVRLWETPRNMAEYFGEIS